VLALASDILSISSDETRRAFSEYGSCLDEKIALARQKLATCAPRECDAETCYDLSLSIFERYYLSGDMELLNETIPILQEFLYPDPPASCNHEIYVHLIDIQAFSLRARYEQTMNQEDLEEAIELHKNSLMIRSSLQLDPSPSLYGLGGAYSTTLLAKRPGYEDFNELALQNLDAALQAMPTSHPLRSRTLSQMNMVLVCVLDDADGREDKLLEIIGMARDAMQYASPGHPDLAFSIHTACRTLYESALLPAHWNGAHWNTVIRAIRFGSTLLDPIRHPYYPTSVLSLAVGIARHEDESQDSPMLEMLVCQARESRERCDRRSVLFMMVAQDLAIVLGEAYRRSGDLKYLDEMVLVWQDIVQTCPDHRPFLHHLATAQRQRFLRTGSQEDLEAAMELSQKCTSMNQVPPEVGEAEYLKLAGQLHTDSFGLSGEVADLDSANANVESCLALLPSLDTSVLDGVAADVVKACYLRLTRHEGKVSANQARDWKCCSDALSAQKPRTTFLAILEKSMHQLSEGQEGRTKLSHLEKGDDNLLALSMQIRQTAVS
jgi:hypothetical protein